MIEISLNQFRSMGDGPVGKYKAIKTECRQKHIHDSMKEATRCNELHMLQKAKKISKLVQQPKYVLLKGFWYQHEKIRPLCYIADFKYIKDGVEIIEDVKGKRTDVYLLKKKLLLNHIKNRKNCLFIET